MCDESPGYAGDISLVNGEQREIHAKIHAEMHAELLCAQLTTVWLRHARFVEVARKDCLADQRASCIALQGTAAS